MTKRDFLMAITTANISEELQQFAQTELEKLDARSEKKRATVSKNTIANTGIKEKILEVLGERKLLASEIAELVELSVQKVSSLCRQMVEDGIVSVEEIKVPKKGKQKAYKAI